jgi:hypothetical protein
MYMELNNGGSHVHTETVYHKNPVLCGHSFMLVTKLNSINLDWNLTEWKVHTLSWICGNMSHCLVYRYVTESCDWTSENI